MLLRASPEAFVTLLQTPLGRAEGIGRRDMWDQ
jgi:hypothetical protein